MGGQDLAARGTAARSRRATLKHAIADGDVDLPALLEGAGQEAHEEIAIEMRIDVLLRAVAGIEWATAREIASAAGVALEARLQTLTIARRRQLAGALRERTER